ncbi:MAG: response regulator transcription factor [Thiolinea sp.]
MRLLLVEDDSELADGLQQRLRQQGFVVDRADNGIDAGFMGDEIDYEAVILDLGLPQRNGLEVLQHWRQAGRQLPVIILTARDAWHEQVDGFKAGADDYLGKPFHFEELLMRLQALIRRTHQAGQARLLHCCGLQLDEEHQQVTTESGRVHQLSATEFRLLRYFMLHPGRILSKSRLTEHVYEQDFDRDSNVIEVYVRHLRRILGDERIQTRRGQGYVFPDPAQTEPAP